VEPLKFFKVILFFTRNHGFTSYYYDIDILTEN